MSVTTRSAGAARRFGFLRLIAGAAYGVLKMRDASFIAHLYSWASTLHYGLEQDLVKRILALFSGLPPSRVDTLGYVTLAYAAVFAIEGVGLWMRKRWAEWMTTLVTASLVPLEICFTRASANSSCSSPTWRSFGI
jgi:uncharacterized membrane protein (DUF2068 family)